MECGRGVWTGVKPVALVRRRVMYVRCVAGQKHNALRHKSMFTGAYKLSVSPSRANFWTARCVNGTFCQR